MTLVLKATENGDGTVVLHVAVDATVIWTTTVPLSVWLSGDAETVAQAVADRYAARKQAVRRRT